MQVADCQAQFQKDERRTPHIQTDEHISSAANIKYWRSIMNVSKFQSTSNSSDYLSSKKISHQTAENTLVADSSRKKISERFGVFVCVNEQTLKYAH